MSLKLNEQYPGRFNNPSADYPQGSFKNRTTPTSEDGSYFEQAWANDQLAFFSSLLSGAGVSANGSIDKVGDSQYYDSLISIIQEYAVSEDASETQKGIVELATQAETQVLSDSSRAVTPFGLRSLVSQIASVSGSSRNLKVSSSGVSALLPVSADSVVVVGAGNIPAQLRNISITINTAASGVNGLDTGTLSASTWYAIYVIWDGTTTAGLISLSATAPVMPSGYTYKSRIGWIRTDSSANKYPLSFIQTGRRVQYMVSASGNVPALPVMASGSVGSVITPTWSAIAVAAFVPATAASIKIVATAQTTSSQVVASPNQSFSGRSGASPAPVLLTFQTGGSQDTVAAEFVLESANIYWASSGAANQVQCFGWEDSL